MKRRLLKGVYQRKKSCPLLWISCVDETGKQIKESGKTTDPKLAEELRNKLLRQVSERCLITTRKFESVTVGELIDI